MLSSGCVSGLYHQLLALTTRILDLAPWNAQYDGGFIPNAQQPAPKRPIVNRILAAAGPNANSELRDTLQMNEIPAVSTMKTLSILVAAARAGPLVSATALAAPQSGAMKPSVASAPDRAAAYPTASAD